MQRSLLSGPVFSGAFFPTGSFMLTGVDSPVMAGTVVDRFPVITSGIPRKSGERDHGCRQWIIGWQDWWYNPK